MDTQIIYTDKLKAIAMQSFVHDDTLYVIVNSQFKDNKNLIDCCVAEIVRRFENKLEVD